MFRITCTNLPSDLQATLCTPAEVEGEPPTMKPLAALGIGTAAVGFAHTVASAEGGAAALGLAARFAGRALLGTSPWMWGAGAALLLAESHIHTTHTTLPPVMPTQPNGPPGQPPLQAIPFKPQRDDVALASDAPKGPKTGENDNTPAAAEKADKGSKTSKEKKASPKEELEDLARRLQAARARAASGEQPATAQASEQLQLKVLDRALQRLKTSVFGEPAAKPAAPPASPPEDEMAVEHIALERVGYLVDQWVDELLVGDPKLQWEAAQIDTRVTELTRQHQAARRELANIRNAVNSLDAAEDVFEREEAEGSTSANLLHDVDTSDTVMHIRAAFEGLKEAMPDLEAPAVLDPANWLERQTGLRGHEEYDVPLELVQTALDWALDIYQPAQALLPALQTTERQLGREIERALDSRDALVAPLREVVRNLMPEPLRDYLVFEGEP